MAKLNGRNPNMEMDDFSEKRAHLRYAVGINAEYMEYFTSAQTPAVTNNICDEGLCIATHKLLLPGTDVDVVLRIRDNGEEIRRHGKVAWCRIVEPEEYRTGIHLDSNLRPIELVLRTIKAQRNY
ncbi:MAG: PilZ domain-containing protein [Candidatus Omnitrophota bacterium]|jgi:Tfp pilus assembly protein PilZ